METSLEFLLPQEVTIHFLALLRTQRVDTLCSHPGQALASQYTPSCCLLFLNKTEWDVLSSPKSVLGDSVIVDTGQVLLVIHLVPFALLPELVQPNFAHICTLL